MNDKTLSFLGLCRRAGKLTMGLDPVKGSVISGESKLILLASDISKHTEKEITFTADDLNIQIVKLSYTKDELGLALGKLTAVISINDGGFAKKLKSMTADTYREEYKL